MKMKMNGFMKRKSSFQLQQVSVSNAFLFDFFDWIQSNTLFQNIFLFHRFVYFVRNAFVCHQNHAVYFHV